MTFIIVLCIAPSSLSCVGARPLGMGGGFIAIADNEDAVYWNPAGLSQITKPKYGLTFTLTGKDQMGYRNYISFVKPNLGLSYISRLRMNNDLEEWYTLSLSRSLNQKLNMGINIRYEIHTLTPQEFHLDIGALYFLNRNIHIGFLFQSLNNLRTGISIKFANTKIGFDFYDILNQPRILYGVEHKLNQNLILRLGSYNKDLTLGISILSNRMSYHIALLFRKTNILLFSVSFP